MHHRRQANACARQGNKAGGGALIDAVRQPGADNFAEQHGDKRHRRQPAGVFEMNAFTLNQVAGQPAVDAPQIGEKGDVEDADHPEVRADKQLAARAAACLLRRLPAAGFCLQRDAAQPDAHKNQYRYRQHRHHKEGALPAEGVKQPNRQREANRRADRRPEQPEHGGARLQMLGKGMADDSERQREQRPFGDTQQNSQRHHQRIVMGKAHHQHQNAPHRHHSGKQAQRRNTVAQAA